MIKVKNKVCIIAPSKSTFVCRDIKILSPEFKSKVCLFPNTKNKKMFIFDILKCTYNIFNSNIVISWFADYSYFSIRIAKIFNKPIIVILGGYDVAYLPEINYGGIINNKNKVKYTLENATRIIAVDIGLRNDVIKHFNKDFNISIIPTGYDYNKYYNDTIKENIVLSVCSANNEKGLVKGIDVFTKCATECPDLNFVIIGIEAGAIKYMGEIPKNLTVIGKVSPNDIINYYKKAKVYCQFSIREGLPNALCEAMLCECIPVGSDVQGIRTAINKYGYLVEYGDIKESCIAIRKALNNDTGKDGRNYIIKNFSENNRKDKLIKIIKELIN